MIPIDKGVPVPARKGSPGPEPKYPWHQLQPGDSFFIPGRKAMSMSGGLNNCRRKHPDWEMIMRYIEEDGVKGTRIWRVK